MKKLSSNIEENTSHLCHKDQRLMLRMVKMINVYSNNHTKPTVQSANKILNVTVQIGGTQNNHFDLIH